MITRPPDTPAVLLVDDNADKLVALESILLDLEVRIVKVRSGPEALRRLLSEEFAVVLLDVRMPDMDGFETAALIRERPRTARTPIIFITAFGDDTHVARGYSLRAVDYLLTPVVPEVLRTKVSVLVELYRATAEIERQAARLRQRAVQLHRLATFTVAVSAEASIEGMLRVAAENARSILRAERVLVRVKLDHRRHHRCETGTPGELEVQGFENEALRIASASGQPCRAGPGKPAVLGVPLGRRDGQPFGAIVVRGSPEGDFTPEDEDLLLQLARTTAVTIENALFREAREANQLKDEFLATVSHELRTPLSAMLAWAWMLRHTSLDRDATARAVETIERNARAQARLVDDLLDVSRIMTGKLRLNRRLVDLATVVRAAVESVMAAADAKGVTVECSIEERAGLLSGDADRLQQVVWNLLSNAIKFSPAGTRVDVRLERALDTLRVRVDDAGEGIAPEFLPHVFERFRQADASAGRTAPGLGLGLAIVRQLVELHGGTVEAHSAGRGKGASFVVTLPAAAADATGPAPMPAVHAPLDSHPCAGLRVLVIEDDRDTRDFVALVLSEAGGEVTAAATVREALDAVAVARFDVAVCDIGLPGEDGYGFIRHLRSRSPEEGGAMPAIALTAYAGASDRTRALAAGFQAHLTKPFDPDHLLDVLRGVVPWPTPGVPQQALAAR